MVGTIEVVGLGAGDLNQLPLGIYKKIIATNRPIIARTLDHPVIDSLMKEDVTFESYDDLYVAEDQFNDVYEQIVADLLAKAEQTSLIYAVPGHPMLAEKTVQLLLEQERINIDIIGGQSYLDALFTTLKIDPIEGFQFVDGTGFTRRELNYRKHLIFSQVYDRFIASQVKLALLEDLPFDYEVTIIEAAGSNMEKIRSLPLEELDHQLDISNLTSVYVPPVPSDLLQHTFLRLKEVIETLRGPDGCSWDKAQTHKSLKAYLIEESYELLEAIDREDDEGIVEELGDILLQVLLHSQIGEDDGYFTIDDVIQSLTTKMIHRHPHVFQETSTGDSSKNWEELKQEEKGEQRTSVLDGIPSHFPALFKAFKLQEKAATVGFDWTDSKDIWLKLNEEVEEVSEAIAEGNHEDIINEFGDVLFVIANLTRYFNINPELALEQTNRKFNTRFSYIEKKLAEEGKNIAEVSLEEMDYYWEEAKREEDY